MIRRPPRSTLFSSQVFHPFQEKGAQHDFGAEAVQIILKRMEDLRGKFGVIVAGYTEKMQGFVTSNPGLKSPFGKFFVFEDYKADEMHTLAHSFFTRKGGKTD